MLPAFRRMKSAPGSVCVRRVGSTRESEQVMKSAFFFPKTSVRNLKNPLTSFSSIVARLSSPVEGLSIQGKHKDAFAELHIDISEDAQDLGLRDLADLLAELVPALRN